MSRQPTTVVPDCPRLIPIRRGDTVFHTLSDREFLCMDTKQERWMNMNPYYRLLFKSPAATPTKQEGTSHAL